MVGADKTTELWRPHILKEVVAQLVERSLPILEVHGSNPIICKNFHLTYLLSTVLKRRK